WAGATYRYSPIDFEIRSKITEKYGEKKIPEGMYLQDWGITYDELEKYYDRFEKTAYISGEEDPLEEERSSNYTNSPIIETTNLTQKYEKPDGQVINQCQYCAFCTHYGCDFGAKADPIVTVIPTAQETGNFELRVNSYVRRVVYDGKKATGVIYIDLKTGQEYEQPADVVVLGGFTFTNTRLLLLSEIGKPYNPETREGVIGRSFHGQFNTMALGARGFF